MLAARQFPKADGSLCMGRHHRERCVLRGGQIAIIVNMSYKPKPIETAGVELSPELVLLTERLAENSHDLWASQRLGQGWSYGPQRDDAKKLHPCLVPYDQLPESEKEYDRIAALGTLKAILKLGYRLLTPQT